MPAVKKTVAEVLEGEKPGKEVEFGVMVIGGASISVPSSKPAGGSAVPMEDIEKERSTNSATPAQGPSGVEILQSEEFWDDLQGFLEQRLKSEAEAHRLKEVFRSVWAAGI